MVEVLRQHCFSLRGSFLMVYWQCHVVHSILVCVCVYEGRNFSTPAQCAKTDLSDCVCVLCCWNGAAELWNWYGLSLIVYIDTQAGTRTHTKTHTFYWPDMNFESHRQLSVWACWDWEINSSTIIPLWLVWWFMIFTRLFVSQVQVAGSHWVTKLFFFKFIFIFIFSGQLFKLSLWQIRGVLKHFKTRSVMMTA